MFLCFSDTFMRVFFVRFRKRQVRLFTLLAQGKALIEERALILLSQQTPEYDKALKFQIQVEARMVKVSFTCTVCSILH